MPIPRRQRGTPHCTLEATRGRGGISPAVAIPLDQRVADLEPGVASHRHPAGELGHAHRAVAGNIEQQMVCFNGGIVEDQRAVAGATDEMATSSEHAPPAGVGPGHDLERHRDGFLVHTLLWAPGSLTGNAARRSTPP